MSKRYKMHAKKITKWRAFEIENQAMSETVCFSLQKEVAIELENISLINSKQWRILLIDHLQNILMSPNRMSIQSSHHRKISKQ